MSNQDMFVEKVTLHNKLINADQLGQAKWKAAQDQLTLLDALQEMGFLNEANAKAVQALFEKNQAAGDPAPAAKPAPGPAAAARPAPPAMAPGRTPPGASAGGAARPVMTTTPARPAAGGGPATIPAPSAPVQPAAPLAGSANVAGFTKLIEYLGYVRSIGASDFHMSVATPPTVRKDGRLVGLQRPPMKPEETEKMLFEILTPQQKEEMKKTKALDFCYTVPNQGRYRSCIVKQRTGWDGSFRVINSKIPSCQELGLPEALRRLTEFHQGLVLVTGPQGCGKSTTLASLVNLVNLERDDHIITLEDPVEYVFAAAMCQVNQREVGSHTKSFANALRAALREDPDVIMVGEMRDYETVSLAITAAETGHLVFGTLHTTSAARTIDRVLDVFPPDDQGQIRAMISESLKGIICQQLVPRKDGKGRALVLEIMLNNPAVANLIRERKMFQMASVMQTGKKQGMVLMDNSLMELVNANVIDGVEGFYAADNKALFAKWAPTF